MRRDMLPWNLLGIVVALGAWEIGGRMLGDGLLAPPSSVLAAFPALLRDGMAEALGTAMLQMLVGYACALLVGIPLGVLMGRSRMADRLLHPWLSMLLVTSTAALVPLFILIFGTGMAFCGALVFMASAFYIMLTAYQGARGIDRRLMAVARSFGATRMQAFRMVLLPGLFPYLVTGARVGLVHAIRAMVMAQMFVMVGFGGLIAQSGFDASTAGLLALLVTIMLVSLALNRALDATGHRLAPWYRASKAGH
ncbi:ABC transporter permease subunit [Roseomonas sp. E05]|uniref:ABC transporter permease n=1 Tax=Roseomonas sp. E05 TaxID=3046310 RepID=UPI0024B98A48|nr:ABC transporter permease subunit [Roseomonas sp. E05]MDJ0391243.1 ABC transporter permease subunit [Roseomonas sp. E05]